MTDHTPTNPPDRIAAALERIATALERAYPDPTPTLRDSQVKLPLHYPNQETPDAWQPSTPDTDGWIEWHGGDCPVPFDTPVYIRNGAGFEPPVASSDVWSWTSTGRASSIVAYRLAK